MKAEYLTSFVLRLFVNRILIKKQMKLYLSQTRFLSRWRPKSSPLAKGKAVIPSGCLISAPLSPKGKVVKENQSN